ncbi:MAG: zinc carboxypeptidase, partial [Bacteroidota bacterium]
ANVGSTSAYNYQTGKEEVVRIASSDLVVSAYQPRSVLTQTLLDPSTYVVDSLTYDITAWSLPYAYGLEAYASTARLSVNAGYTFGKPGNDLSNAAPYAYLVPWESTHAARFLAQLMKAGIQVRTATSPFQLEGKSHERGTLVITRADNRKNEDFDATVRGLIKGMGITASTVKTGFADLGPDLGSGSMTLLKAPRVGLIAGEGTFSNEAGQVWHYFEDRLDYPVHIFYPDDLERWTGKDIDLLIMPEGFYDLDEAAAGKLATWVRGGGKLIGIGAALSSLAGKPGFGLEFKSPDEDNTPSQPHQDHSYAGAERRSIAEAIPGAIFGVDMDNTHPL